MVRKEPVSSWQALWLVALTFAGTAAGFVLSGNGIDEGWAAVLATIGTGMGAVYGAFLLWKAQQREKTERLLRAGVTLFVGVHRNLLELKAFSDYDTFVKFNRQITGLNNLHLGRDVHKKGVETFLDTLIVNSNFATASISTLIGNLGDVDAGKVDAFMRLAHLVNGLPAQALRIRAEWMSAEIDHRPAKLSDDHSFLVAYGIAASAYYLEKLGRPQGQNTALYAQVHAVQIDIWEGRL